MEADKVGVHRTHCCVLHGCKYGDKDCPVSGGTLEQDYPCEDCTNDPVYLIWCVERSQWWKPNGCGYTSDINEAGRYSELRAYRILKQANIHKQEEVAVKVSSLNDEVEERK